MKIVHYSRQLGIGGTEKNMQYLLEYLQQAGHDCYCMHNQERTRAAGGYRVRAITELLGESKVIGFTSESEFFDRLDKIRPRIFHVHRSGSPGEFPVVPELKRYVSKCVETNVFGGYDPGEVIDLTLYISAYLIETAPLPRRGVGVLHYPVKMPTGTEDLRKALHVSPGTFVMGRIGRADDHIFDPISLYALKVIEEQHPDYDILYLVQSPPPAMIRMASNLGLRKIKFLTDPIVEDSAVTRFFNTLDALAHARRDGETFGLNIVEAMIHGKPVISHWSRIANGHVDFVKRCGFVADVDNYRQYASYVLALYEKPVARAELGKAGLAFAAKQFLLSRVGHQLEGYYSSVLDGTIRNPNRLGLAVRRTLRRVRSRWRMCANVGA